MQRRELGEAGWDERTLIRSGQGDDRARPRRRYRWTDQDSEGSTRACGVENTTAISVSGVTIGHRVGLTASRLYFQGLNHVKRHYDILFQSHNNEQ